MLPSAKILIAYVLLGLTLLFIFNFITVLVYEVLGLNRHSLLVGLILVLITILLFYMYIAVSEINIFGTTLKPSPKSSSVDPLLLEL